MERIRVMMGAAAYDELVHGSVPEFADLTVAYKSGGMQSGRGAVCIAFTAQVDGKPVKVQATTSARVFLSALAIIAEAEEQAIGAIERARPAGHA